MEQYLRLDLYIGSREYLIGEADATGRGFDDLVSAASIAFQASDDELGDKGYTMLTPDQLADEDMQQVLWDFAGREIETTEEVRYVMCLWHKDENGEPEHLKSHIKRSDVE